MKTYVFEKVGYGFHLPKTGVFLCAHSIEQLTGALPEGAKIKFSVSRRHLRDGRKIEFLPTHVGGFKVRTTRRPGGKRLLYHIRNLLPYLTISVRQLLENDFGNLTGKALYFRIEVLKQP